MARKYLSPYHKREALVARRRFGLMNALLVVALVAVGYRAYMSSHAAGGAIGIAATPSGQGFWRVEADGHIYASGDATTIPGSFTGGPYVSGIAARRDGPQGYWVVNTSGKVMGFNAPFKGDPSSTRIPGAITGIASAPPSPSGVGGYVLLGTDGSTYNYGTGCPSGTGFHRTDFTNVATTTTGNGCWLVTTDGAVYTTGLHAPYFGGCNAYTGHARCTGYSIVGIARTATNNGYWLVSDHGQVWAFGDAVFYGAPGGVTRGIIGRAPGNGYAVAGSGVTSAYGPAPSAHISASPPSVTAGGSSTISWSSAETYKCAGGGGLATGNAISGSQVQGGITSTRALSVTCYGYSQAAAASVTVGVTQPAPVLNFSATATKIAYNSSTTLNWSGANITICTASLGWSGAKPTSGSFTTPRLTAPTTYRLACSGPGGAVTKDIGITVGNASPPPPGGTTTPTPTPDTQPPTKPEGFTASADSVGVNLKWQVSTDNIGVTGYKVERSTDKTTWSSIGDNVTDVTYLDSTVSYDTQYYYRLTAHDAAGNVSDFASTDLKVPAFKSNTADTGDTKIYSDDGQVSIVLPQGTVQGDVACSVGPDDDHKANLPLGKLELLSGPYSLICRKATGETLDQLTGAATWNFSFTKDQLKRYGSYKFEGYDTDASVWSALKMKYDKKTKTYSFQTTALINFAVLGAKKKGIPAYVWWTLLSLAIIAGGVFLFLWRRQQKSSYNDYLRRKYYNL